MATLELADLIMCTYHRDGGSYEAQFRTSTGATFALSLLVNTWDHPRDIRYTDLFEATRDATASTQPVAKGSPREQVILTALRAWLDQRAAGADADSVELLREMIDEIPRRIGGAA